MAVVLAPAEGLLEQRGAQHQQSLEGAPTSSEQLLERAVQDAIFGTSSDEEELSSPSGGAAGPAETAQQLDQTRLAGNAGGAQPDGRPAQPPAGQGQPAGAAEGGSGPAAAHGSLPVSGDDGPSTLRIHLQPPQVGAPPPGSRLPGSLGRASGPAAANAGCAGEPV